MAGILVVVVLMVPLSWVKFLKLFYLRHDLRRAAGVMPILLNLLQYLLDDLHFLLIIFLMHDYGTILGPRVVSLTVQSRRIM